jgi:DNA-binding FrmR family transcriptional regulator
MEQKTEEKSFAGMTDAEKFRLIRRELTSTQGRVAAIERRVHELDALCRALSDRVDALQRAVGRKS